jgi:hypothetical protein
MGQVQTPPPPMATTPDFAGHDPFAGEGRVGLTVRIGVTGHRDLGDQDKLAAAVRHELEKIRDRVPCTPTTQVRFVVLSSLAEGADRLVAQVGFELLGDDDLELQAVLPMEVADYVGDFHTAASRAAFDELLAKATTCRVMPKAADRDEAYERAGQYVVEHSDVVIALWDGGLPGGRAGTAEIVSFARRRGVPVVVVPTARAGDTEHASLEAQLDALRRPVKLDHVDEAYRRIKELNRRSLRERRLRRQLEDMDTRLSKAAADSQIHWRYRIIAAWALPNLVRADALALKYQRWYYRLAGGLYILAALAVVAVAAQSQADWSSKLALFEVGCMLVLVTTYGIARRLRLHDRWLGYRSLAEAFRSALFISMSGARARSADEVQRDHEARDEPWFQRAFSEAWRLHPQVGPEPSTAVALRRFLIEAWIEDQIGYHRRTLQRFRARRKRLTAAVFALFSLTIVIGVLHAFEVVGGGFWPNLFIFLALALPAVGAGLTGVRDQRQYRLHEQRSSRTASRLERLRHRMESQSELTRVQKLVAQVQSVIEAEQLDWWSVIEFQDMEMVI